MNVYHKFPPAGNANQKRADEMNVGLKNPQADICGLDMVWDGARCRVPVGKRQSDLADTPCPPPRVRSASGECVIMTNKNKREAETDEEKRQIGCPPGLIKWQGGCFTPGVAASTVTEQAKRQLSYLGCPEGTVPLGNGACLPKQPIQNPEKRDEGAMDKRITCPEGTTMTKTGGCLNIPILPKKRQVTTLPAVMPCPVGTVLKNGQCVNFSLGAIPRKRQDPEVTEAPEHTCPLGEIWRDGACERVPVVWWA
jgi:hypothetical protein